MIGTKVSQAVKNGFTLIEVLVAMLIFSLIMIIVSSTFIYALTLERRALSIQEAEENATYVLELLRKEIRVSTIDPVADTDCSSAPAPSLTIHHPDEGDITYMLKGSDFERTAGGDTRVMNASTVEFSSIGFCILGALDGDSEQPRVTILARVKTKSPREEAVVDIETTVSLRQVHD